MIHSNMSNVFHNNFVCKNMVWTKGPLFFPFFQFFFLYIFFVLLFL
jgi:hypothetical protein